MERITEFEQLLSKALSGKVIEQIVASVLLHEEDFPQIYGLTKVEDPKVSWRAAWACEKIAEKCPAWFLDKRTDMMESALQTHHSGKKRLVLSILCQLPLKDVMTVDFLNACFEWMFSPKESIAVQALSIHLAYKLCQYEPELLPELQLYLENAQLEYLSAGIRSTVRNTLKKINKRK